MKHLIITILLTFVFFPIFALTKANIMGEWVNGNTTLKITADSLFWDEYTDTTRTELIEGDCYSYTLINDTITYHNVLDEYKIIIAYIKEEDMLVIRHLENNGMKINETNIILLNKFDLNQENKEVYKFVP